MRRRRWKKYSSRGQRLGGSHANHARTGLGFFARGWMHFATAAAGCFAIASMVCSSFSRYGNVAAAYRDLHFGFYWVILFVVGTAAIHARRRPQNSDLLCQPAKRAHRIEPSGVCCGHRLRVVRGCEFGVNMTFQAGWPIVAPGMIGAVLVAWFFVVIWSTANSKETQVAAGGVSLLLFLVSMAVLFRYASPPDVFETLGIWHGLFCIVAFTHLDGSGTVGFGNVRHGGGIDLQRVIDVIVSRLPTRSASTLFRSPQRAQSWQEWPLARLCASSLGGRAVRGRARRAAAGPAALD